MTELAYHNPVNFREHLFMNNICYYYDV